MLEDLVLELGKLEKAIESAKQQLHEKIGNDRNQIPEIIGRYPEGLSYERERESPRLQSWDESEHP